MAERRGPTSVKHTDEDQPKIKRRKDKRLIVLLEGASLETVRVIYAGTRSVSIPLAWGMVQLREGSVLPVKQF